MIIKGLFFAFFTAPSRKSFRAMSRGNFIEFSIEFNVLIESTTSSKIYSEVASKLREINALEGISGLLGWDEMVMLPSQSSDSRGKQKSALAGVIYDKKTEDSLGLALEDLTSNLEELNPV